MKMINTAKQDNVYKNIIHIDFNHVDKTHQDVNIPRVAPIDTVSKATVHVNAKKHHDAQPFKTYDDIRAISNYFIQHYRFRNNLLFICGINFGIRISDLLKLHFSDLIDDNGVIKESFEILEQKTESTRKKTKNRIVGINDAVRQALILYLTHNKCSLDDYLFPNESNNAGLYREPLTRKGAEYVIKSVTKTLNIKGRYNTHSLRKTFGRFYMIKHKDDPQAIYKLQIIFGHSSPAITKRYIGIEDEEIKDSYMELNLGLHD